MNESMENVYQNWCSRTTYASTVLCKILRLASTLLFKNHPYLFLSHFIELLILRVSYNNLNNTSWAPTFFFVNFPLKVALLMQSHDFMIVDILNGMLWLKVGLIYSTVLTDFPWVKLINDLCECNKIKKKTPNVVYTLNKKLLRWINLVW